ncbi:GPI-anchored CFEM domain protein [Lachnellula cervina]|uniref:GPI-anchored CFEM domain protein n=1 Tax=Lachnellula cervina TaxID=1316786 RepID=A0A7D8YY27_9HELO|nr:GPI-anchored CFEM domain protein [Lachnellula cervina]
MSHCRFGNASESWATQFTTGTTVGGRTALDIPCICASSGFLDNIACCFAASCNSRDQAATVAFAKNLCTTSGATNVSSAVVCSTSNLFQATEQRLLSQLGSCIDNKCHDHCEGNAGAHNLAGIVAGMIGALVALLLV